MNQEKVLLGYGVITMIIVLVTTKEKSLRTNFNQENWMLVIWLNIYIRTTIYLILHITDNITILNRPAIGPII